MNAIVIGSGFGGLATAIRLQAMGMSVTLLEKREKIGGRAYQLKGNGYTFDMGPSLITAPDIIDELFQLAGKSFQSAMQPTLLDPFYRVYFADGTSFDYSPDTKQMVRQMAQFNAKDAGRYEEFLNKIRPIYDAVITDGLGSQPFDSIGKMASFVPKAIKLGLYQSTYRYAANFFEDFRHRFLFSFHPLFIGGSPFNTPAVYAMIPYLEKNQGVWYTQGGMYSLVEALGQIFEELGGTIQTNAGVEEIVVREGKAVGVRTADEYLAADIVISNADVGHTYAKLIAPEHRKKYTDKKVDSIDYSMSCFLLYLGVRKKYDKLKHHTIILSERYKELIDDIFVHKVLPDDFSLYLHAPSITDPSMAPEGCESLYVLAPVANLTSGVDWNEMAPKFEQKILSFLEEWGLKDLQANIEFKQVFTPLDFETQLSSWHGNAFGIEPKLTQTAYLRPHNRSEDIDGLYFVGAGTHPGAGVPGVMLSAAATASAVAEDHSQILALTREEAA